MMIYDFKKLQNIFNHIHSFNDKNIKKKFVSLKIWSLYFDWEKMKSIIIVF